MTYDDKNKISNNTNNNNNNRNINKNNFKKMQVQ
jgi:hypothetical protein